MDNSVSEQLWIEENSELWRFIFIRFSYKILDNILNLNCISFESLGILRWLLELHLGEAFEIEYIRINLY